MSWTPREIGTLIVVILKARNLPNKRHIGKQDPYCAVSYNGEKRRTKAIRRGGQHPEWDEEVRFTLFEDAEDQLARLDADSDAAPPPPPPKENDAAKGERKIKGGKAMRLFCFADDPREPDLIGECVVDLTEVLTKGETDEWFTLTNKERYCGEVYLELTFWSNEPAPEKKKPKSKKTSKQYGGPGMFTELSGSLTGGPGGHNGSSGSLVSDDRRESLSGSLASSSSDLYVAPYDQNTARQRRSSPVDQIVDDFGALAVGDPYQRRETYPDPHNRRASSATRYSGATYPPPAHPYPSSSFTDIPPASNSWSTWRSDAPPEPTASSWSAWQQPDPYGAPPNPYTGASHLYDYHPQPYDSTPPPQGYSSTPSPSHHGHGPRHSLPTAPSGFMPLPSATPAPSGFAPMPSYSPHPDFAPAPTPTPGPYAPYGAPTPVPSGFVPMPLAPSSSFPQQYGGYAPQPPATPQPSYAPPASAPPPPQQSYIPPQPPGSVPPQPHSVPLPQPPGQQGYAPPQSPLQHAYQPQQVPPPPSPPRDQPSSSSSSGSRPLPPQPQALQSSGFQQQQQQPVHRQSSLPIPPSTSTIPGQPIYVPPPPPLGASASQSSLPAVPPPPPLASSGSVPKLVENPQHPLPPPPPPPIQQQSGRPSLPQLPVAYPGPPPPLPQPPAPPSSQSFYTPPNGMGQQFVPPGPPPQAMHGGY
ncbi:hypothetical protein PUNSTDRAFT_125244 [Punctularia strigosozonata HHB-11173 SS5]|uniref:uncharacterized protein n=1 Tax=Punctularia strigosozonata (strain HHB-11173) TaxID=741275 RepID=UPI000441870A|nr:uncharacterized protein PUNSTDRAFT_125244 [Punctularia strigosozonata HHB-11173 SS5]EIN10344.1 hypothetical protein PUNSTDRAFT_125244 [Punctularia strigosozonata HHB-11173 SS5]